MNSQFYHCNNAIVAFQDVRQHVVHSRSLQAKTIIERAWYDVLFGPSRPFFQPTRRATVETRALKNRPL